MTGTWSVELEGTLWTDDTFNGSYEDCYHYCREGGYHFAPLETEDGLGCRIAHVILDDHGCVDFTDEIIDDDEEARITLEMERRSPRE